MRSCATCTVNGREEQLWSSYSPPTLCCWERIQEITKEEVEGEGSKKEAGSDREKSLVSVWTVGVLLFIVVTLFTVVVALILGQLVAI